MKNVENSLKSVLVGLIVVTLAILWFYGFQRVIEDKNETQEMPYISRFG